MTKSYPTLRELIRRLEGNDKKVCDLALYCLIAQDKQIKELRAEVEKYKAIASKSIQEQVDIREGK